MKVWHNMWNPFMELLFHEQISGAFEPFVDEIDLAKKSRSLVFLPLIYSATRKAFTILHEASSWSVSCGTGSHSSI